MIESQNDIPPQDITAEACVIGCLFLEPDLLPKLRAFVAAEDFFRPENGQIFKAASYIVEHPAKWGKLDLVTFKSVLTERGSFCNIVGKPTEAEALDYLNECMQVPGIANAEFYARSVRDKSRLRKAWAAALELIESVKGANGDADDVLLAAAAKMETVLQLPSERTTTPAAEVSAVIEETISGQRKSIAWPWPALSKAAKPAAPGCVTVICGDPGSNKSFLLQEAMLFWTRHGIPVAMLHLEKNRRYHLARAMSQLEGDGNLTSEDWQNAHPMETREAMARHLGEIAAYGDRLWDAPPDVTMEWVSQWLMARATEGSRIIGVDPVTAADAGQRPWETDRKFIITCQSLAARHACTVVLVTHPRITKGQKPTLETMAGGLAYARLTDVVLWVAAHEPPKNGVVVTPLGHLNTDYTNHIAIFKTRDSTGRGTHIAYNFNRATLRMEEIGCILKE